MLQLNHEFEKRASTSPTVEMLLVCLNPQLACAYCEYFSQERQDVS